jgi:hypothetical protein
VDDMKSRMSKRPQALPAATARVPIIVAETAPPSVRERARHARHEIAAARRKPAAAFVTYTDALCLVAASAYG